MNAPLRGGIIAAGEGRRLRASGFAMPKPLVPVAGAPLLAHVVANFRAAGIGAITAIVNEDSRECATFLERSAPDLDVRCIVKTTRSSLESFFEVAGDPAPGPMLISTVDAVCSPRDFAGFAAAAAARPRESVVLAVTPFVADEAPLWVDLGRDGRITALGGARGAFVTAGFYLVPERLRRMTPPAHLGRLREFLGWLVQTGEVVYGEVIATVVDVDRSEDVALAEALAHAQTSSEREETRP